MISNCFLQYIAGYTVATFWRYPIRRQVTESSALEFQIIIIYEKWDSIQHKVWFDMWNNQRPRSACAPAQSNYRFLVRYGTGSKGSIIYTGRKLKLWLECGDTQIHFNHCCTHMSTGTLCWVLVHNYYIFVLFQDEWGRGNVQLPNWHSVRSEVWRQLRTTPCLWNKIAWIFVLQY